MSFLVNFFAIKYSFKTDIFRKCFCSKIKLLYLLKNQLSILQEGEKISAGDVLCEIQTDKAVVSMEIDDDAVLAKILFPEGSSGVKVRWHKLT